MLLREKSLEELLPGSVSSTPAVSINSDDTLAEVAVLLPHHLETFTDSLVVTKNDSPVGIVGGVEILDTVLKNQTRGHLDKTKVSEVMNKNITIVDTKTKLGELVDKWSKTRRAFAIMPNKYKGYSAISARKILEIGTNYIIEEKINKIPRKKIVMFHKQDTVEKIISSMFENHTRKIILEGTNLFINDRIIIQKMVREYDCLRDNRDFLKESSEIFSLEEAKRISEDTTLSSACSIMQDMASPYLLTSQGVVSPWDMVLAISSIQKQD